MTFADELRAIAEAVSIKQAAERAARVAADTEELLGQVLLAARKEAELGCRAWIFGTAGWEYGAVNAVIMELQNRGLAVDGGPACAEIRVSW